MRGGEGSTLVASELQCEALSNNGERAFVREELSAGERWKSRDSVSGVSEEGPFEEWISLRFYSH